jgi:apolipoprotein N-acyltransferase
LLRLPDAGIGELSTFTRVSLSMLSGILLGAAFPPSTFGALACGALVPLLLVLFHVRSVTLGLRYVYVAMFVFHVITLNWTGGYAHMKDPYMMIAGGLTMVVHPLFYFLPFGLFLAIRNRLGPVPALAALPFLWVAYEFSHSLSEWSFPWLTLGNTQTFDLARIQIVSITGVYGLSFWILVMNVLLVWLWLKLSVTEFGSRTWLTIIAIAIVGLLPWAIGSVILEGSEGAGTTHGMDRGSLRVGLIQSNIDPWDKWAETGTRSLDKYLGLSSSIAPLHPDLILWPETAIPFFLMAPVNRPVLADLQTNIDRLGVPVLTGVPYYVEYPDSNTAPRSAKISVFSRERYDTFNAAIFLQPGVDSIPWYGKMKMVPLAERIPYAEYLSSLDFLRWGVGIGGWQLGPRQVMFHDHRTGASFPVAICYESVYPDFVASSVRAGAEFLAIITIDSWWDHMSGAYQHERYAVLRAVENRRWVARCAVGGISCFIDPYGRVSQETCLFTEATPVSTIGRSSELSFYTAHGEWFSMLCVWVSAAFLAASAGKSFLSTYRKQQWTRP